MLGEQYAELKGKITSQRVLDAEGPSLETSVSVSGTMKGVKVEEMITFVDMPTSEKGIIHGIGRGVIMVAGGEAPEVVTYTGEGIGRVSSAGNIEWRGSTFLKSHPVIN